MVLRPQTITNVRALIRNLRTPGLYSVFSAIRGPDDNKYESKTSEISLKMVTKAIRSYVGFDSESCSGDLIWGIRAGDIQAKIVQVDALHKGNNASHYVNHLFWALNAIGRENLVEYVRQKNLR